MKLLNSDAVRDAYELISPKIRQTPILASQRLEAVSSSVLGAPFVDFLESKKGMELFFKCENMQITGSFKFRGATHAITRMKDENLVNGVVTGSSGK